MRKEKVHLRTKVLANGRVGYYLDYSVNGKRKQLTLKGFTSFKKPKNLKERNHNKDVQNKVRGLRNQQEQEIISNYFSETVIYKPKTSFVEFCEDIAEQKNNETSTRSVWLSMVIMLKKFSPNVKLCELDENWQEDWKNYLLENVSQNTANSYNSKSRAAIKEAIERKLIQNQRIVKGIPYEEVRREYLTIEEIQMLIDTKCDKELYKRAFLFSCLCGLRFSDVHRLTWNDIRTSKGQSSIYFKQKKTKWLESIPINEQAMKLMDTYPNGSERVFKGLKYSAHLNHKLALWVLRAGIKKKITFHSARHTYAVLLLDNGVDIFTVSKMMGHKDIKSTQVYLKFTDELKSRAMHSIPSFSF